MKKFIQSLALFLVLTNIVFGQDYKDYRMTLKKLLEVSGTEERHKTSITQMSAILKEQYSGLNTELFDEIEKEFLKTTLDDIVDMYVPIYSKYLTQNDLEELITFYQSPVGQKFVKCTSSITQESVQVGMQWGMKIKEKYEEKMKEKGY